MTLLKRNRVLAAKIETTPGTAVALSAADAVFNVYDAMIQPDAAFEEREGQQGFGYLSSVPAGKKGTATFRTEVAWDGSGIPAWASTFLPACGFVASSQTYYPKTAAPGSDVKTLTIGLYEDGRVLSLKGAAGNFRLVGPTGRMAYIEWTFSGVWVTPSDSAILNPTYTFENPLRAANGATTFNAVTLCAESFSIDVGNQVYVRECATDDGYSAAIITNRNPKITINPEAKLVATRADYTQLFDMTEAAWHAEFASVTGDGNFGIDAPKAQIINVQEGDRERLVTSDLEFQCNRNGNTEDQEIYFTFTDDA